MEKLFEAVMDSPIGPVTVRCNLNSVRSVSFTGDATPSAPPDAPAVLRECLRQLQAYFYGDLRTFSLPLAPEGTAFQRTVWDELCRIPYGSTCSYLQLANRLGDPKSIRAAASANGRNPVAVIIPCHRVIGSDGSLTGYAGGLHRKQWLLEHELLHTPSSDRLF